MILLRELLEVRQNYCMYWWFEFSFLFFFVCTLLSVADCSCSWFHTLDRISVMVSRMMRRERWHCRLSRTIWRDPTSFHSKFWYSSLKNWLIWGMYRRIISRITLHGSNKPLTECKVHALRITPIKICTLKRSLFIVNHHYLIMMTVFLSLITLIWIVPIFSLMLPYLPRRLNLFLQKELLL